MCCDRHHKDHSVELIETQGESISQELNHLQRTLSGKIYQIGNMMDVLKKDQTKLAVDIQWTCDKFQEKANGDCCELKLRENEVRGAAQNNVEHENIQKEAHKKIGQLQVEKDIVQKETQQTIRELEQ